MFGPQKEMAFLDKTSLQFLFRVVAKSSAGHAMPHRLKFLELRNLPKPSDPLRSVNVRQNLPFSYLIYEHFRWSEVSKKVRPHGFKIEHDEAR